MIYYELNVDELFRKMEADGDNNDICKLCSSTKCKSLVTVGKKKV